jgi:hypothetical protein
MLKPMDRWAEPPIMEGKKMESLGKILAGAFLPLHAPLQSRQKSLNRSGLGSASRIAPRCPRRQVVLLAARPFWQHQ